MQKKRKRWLAANGTLLPLFAMLAYLLLSGKESGAVHADAGITTE